MRYGCRAHRVAATRHAASQPSSRPRRLAQKSSNIAETSGVQ